MRNRFLLRILFPALLMFILSSCHRKATHEKIEIVEKPMTQGPGFNADSAYTFVERQVNFGPRIPGSPPHNACSHYLYDKLTSYGANVSVQEFKAESYDGQELDLKNIIASFDFGTPRHLLLAAHWDTRPFADKDTLNPRKPFDGANDGASGVGVLLEIARLLSTANHPNTGIDIIFFDGEDDGEPEFDDQSRGEGDSNTMWWCLGSQHWAKNPHKKNYSAYYGILLDMVGARNAHFYKEGSSLQFAKKITDHVWHIAELSGYSDYFINADSPGITDDHIFINRDTHIPTIDIIDFDPEREDSYFPPYHHTHADNMKIIDKNTLKAVGQTLVNVIYNE